MGLVEFNFNPSVGVYAFWNDAGFKGDDLKLHVEAWPDDWASGSARPNASCSSDERTVQLRVSGLTRPDKVFYGLGPSSLEAPESLRDPASRRGRRLRVAVLAVEPDRDVCRRARREHEGRPLRRRSDLTQEAATGAFAVPFGFGREYTAEYNEVVAALDSRGAATRPAPAHGWSSRRSRGMWS